MDQILDHRNCNVSHLEHAWAPWTSTSDLPDVVTLFFKNLLGETFSGFEVSFKVDDRMSVRVATFEGKNYISYKTGKWFDSPDHPKEHVRAVFQAIFPHISDILLGLDNVSSQLGVVRMDGLDRSIVPNIIPYDVEVDEPIVLSLVSWYKEGKLCPLNMFSCGSVNRAVHLVNPVISDPPNVGPDLKAKLKMLLNEVLDSRHLLREEKLSTQHEFLRGYMNSSVRRGRSFFNLGEYIDFLNDSCDSEEAKLKTSRGKARKNAEYILRFNDIYDRTESFERCLSISQRVREITPEVISSYSHIELPGLKAPKGHEGLVVRNGYLSFKLVDEKFTRDNYTKWKRR